MEIKMHTNETFGAYIKTYYETMELSKEDYDDYCFSPACDREYLIDDLLKSYQDLRALCIKQHSMIMEMRNRENH